MNVDVFNHKGYEVNYLLNSNNALDYTASAKMILPNGQASDCIPLILSEHVYTKSTETEGAIITYAKILLKTLKRKH